MIYRILASAVVVIHAMFVGFVVLGGFLAVRWPWLSWLHVPAAIWGAAVEFGGWVCPLTPLENGLRVRAGQAGYSGGFIDHYVLRALYPSDLTRTVEIILGALVVIVNIVAYTLVFRRFHRP